MIRAVAALLVVSLLAGCDPKPTESTAPTPTDAAAELLPGARVSISPAAALLTAIGQSRALQANAVDAAGGPVAGSTAWSSSHPEVVEVAADGTVTGRAFGASQIVAEINGVRSPATTVVVAVPAPGVKLVEDAQVVAVAAIDERSYRVELKGLTLAAGDHVLGTGERPIAGRVAAVDGGSVTVELVPLHSLLPGFSMNETIDLSNAAVRLRRDVVRLYDVTRVDDTFTFTPKADFMELLAPATGAASDMRPAAFRIGGEAATNAAAVTGTSALPPFEECESSLTGVGGVLPIQLSDPPAFTMTISPTLDVAYTPDGELVHWLVRATPKATLNASIKINAQVEGKIECKHTFFEYVIPIGGALSVFLSGLVPVGLGFVLDGKIILATATLGARAEASTTLALGVECAAGGCDVAKAVSDFKVDPKWTFEAPSVASVRIQPSFEVYGFVKARIGSPLITALGIDVASAKVGGKLSADWAPRISQMADKLYRSEYKLTLEAGVAVGTRLGDLATRLGVPAVNAVAFKASTDLYHSPTAKVVLDKARYASGDIGLARVRFAPADNLRLLGLEYNVKQVVLAAQNLSSGAALGYDQLAVVTATENQTEFDVPFTAVNAVNAADIYAFVVPRFLSLADELALELEQTGRPRLGFFQNGAASSVDIDGANGGPVLLGSFSAPAPLAVASPSGRHWAYVSGGKLFVSGPDGLDAHQVGSANGDWTLRSYLSVAWSPDESRIAYALDAPGSLVIASVDGSASRSVAAPTGEEVYGVTWAPDGARIAFESFSTIYAIGPDDASPVAVTQRALGCATCVLYFSPAWSPDSSQLAAIAINRQTKHTDLVVMAADGSGVTPISRDIGLALRATPMAWSSEGIAFPVTRVSGNTASYSVWAVDSDGTGLRQLVLPQGSIPAPYWFQQP